MRDGVHRSVTRVLIVEDEPLVSMLLLDLVEDSGFTAVGSVETPEEALAVATRQQPDIAIIDINLRRARDGIPLGAQLSRLGTSIIFTSGHDDLGNWPEIKSLEPVAILTKPCAPSDLATALNAAADAQRTACRSPD